MCILALWHLYLYVITTRSGQEGVDRRSKQPEDPEGLPRHPEDPEGRTRRPEAPEDQEDYEDLLGSRPFMIEYLLGSVWMSTLGALALN